MSRNQAKFIAYLFCD